MDVPFVSRVTVPDGLPPEDQEPIMLRLETLTDGVATANRAARALRMEVEALRHVVLMALILAGAIYLWRGI